MKISEMSTEQLAKAILSVSEPLSRIAQSEILNSALVEYRGDYNENQTVMQKASGLLGKVVPALLCTHYDDVIKVIAVMTDKSVEEVHMQNGVQTIAEVKKFFDEDFVGFFTAFATAKNNV